MSWIRSKTDLSKTQMIRKHLTTGRSGRPRSITDLLNTGSGGSQWYWNHCSAEPSFELVERQQYRERDEANALIAFYTDRGVGYKYRPKKKGKKSKKPELELPQG